MAEATTPKPSAAPSKAKPKVVPETALVSDEGAELAKFARLRKLINIQTCIIAGLGLTIVLILPFAQPVYMYFALKPDKTAQQMIGLTAPNMTSRAVLAWATTSITEIMTMGFGDMDTRVPLQRYRFTSDGWDAFLKAFIKQKIGTAFRKSQLVLTTVPSNTPVIVSQGVNQDQVYQWVIQMPVIMTYATNNNVTDQKSSIVTLIIVRVSPEQSPAGIAIQKWAM